MTAIPTLLTETCWPGHFYFQSWWLINLLFNLIKWLRENISPLSSYIFQTALVQSHVNLFFLVAPLCGQRHHEKSLTYSTIIHSCLRLIVMAVRPLLTPPANSERMYFCELEINFWRWDLDSPFLRLSLDHLDLLGVHLNPYYLSANLDFQSDFFGDTVRKPLAKS